MVQKILSLAVFSLGLGACGTQPVITNTSITPTTWAVSGIADDAQFTLTTDVLHLGGTVTKVTGAVEGQDIKFDLVKQGDVTGGERWSITTRITLWTGISSGTYYVNLTATDNNGTTVTQNHGATVTVTN